MELNKFERKLNNLLRARYSLFYVITWEDERFIQVLYEFIRKCNKTPNIIIWDVVNGFSRCDGPDMMLVPIDKEGSSLVDPVAAINYIIKYSESNVIFVLKDFHSYISTTSNPMPNLKPIFIRLLKNASYECQYNQNITKSMFLISNSLDIPNEMQKDFTILDFELPTVEDIASKLDSMLEEQEGKIKVELSEDDREKLIHSALGLTIHEVENAFAIAMVNDKKLTKDDIGIIVEEKRQIIKKTNVLEFINTKIKKEDIGGLENLKRWLSKRDKSWSAEARRYGLPIPKGILITGVPGCGKSLTAKAISAAWNLPLIKLDMGRVFGSFVGQSESNMRAAIKTSESIAPCILWVDEIEKGLGLITNDGGVSSRVFASFLTWLQEKEKPVFVIATANNIDRLPAELLRKGRFDEVFFVDLPTKSERLEIFRVHINRRLMNSDINDDIYIHNVDSYMEFLNKLADITEDFSGAEIEQVVIDSLFEAFSNNRKVCKNDFFLSIQRTVPLAITQAEQIERIRTWAATRAVSATQDMCGDFDQSLEPEEIKIAEDKLKRSKRIKRIRKLS